MEGNQQVRVCDRNGACACACVCACVCVCVCACVCERDTHTHADRETEAHTHMLTGRQTNNERERAHKAAGTTLGCIFQNSVNRYFAVMVPIPKALYIVAQPAEVWFGRWNKLGWSSGQMYNKGLLWAHVQQVQHCWWQKCLSVHKSQNGVTCL